VPHRGSRRRSHRQRLPWANLLRRVFGIDVLVSPKCAGPRRVLAAIHDPTAIARVLAALGLTAARADPAGCRATRPNSAAMMNALELRRDLGALPVGEPSAQKPNSFGEVRAFRLPFSGLEVGCSTRRYRLVDGDPPTFDPDVLVPTTFDDVHRGRDPVLEWALAHPWG